MGTFLDSPKNLWKDKESPSRQAYCSKKKLEKNEN
jgi:hypothetical protein